MGYFVWNLFGDNSVITLWPHHRFRSRVEDSGSFGESSSRPSHCGHGSQDLRCTLYKVLLTHWKYGCEQEVSGQNKILKSQVVLFLLWEKVLFLKRCRNAPNSFLIRRLSLPPRSCLVSISVLTKRWPSNFSSSFNMASVSRNWLGTCQKIYPKRVCVCVCARARVQKQTYGYECTHETGIHMHIASSVAFDGYRSTTGRNHT